MTAEIAVLNKHAVALASDSAVTISHADGEKIFNSINKLFTLSKYAPIGAMFYGDADFMDVPLEPLLKLHRSALGKKRFGTVEGYAKNLVRFLEQHDLFRQRKRQDEAFERRIFQLFRMVRTSIELALENYTSISKAMIKDTVDATLDSEEDHLTYHSKLPRLPKGFVSRRKTSVEEIRRHTFQRLPLTAPQKRRLYALAERQFYSDYMPQTTGMVVAGFGEDEIYPALVSMNLDSVYGRSLRHVSSSIAIDDDKTAMLIPFAQQEMVATFMKGIDPQLEQALDTSLATLLGAVPVDVIAKRLKLSAAQTKTLDAILRSVGQRTINMFRRNIADYQRDVHISPVTAALAHLPKEELAELAESLVHLTSLKRRVALETETVGGPIDVAIISKGDGFIWLKRKHYFKPELNPYFFATYYKREAYDD